MQIRFKSSKLRKICNESKLAKIEFGKVGGEKLMRRLDELEAGTCLEDIRKLPQARCHELTGDRKGQLSVDLQHPFRLIFEPDHNPIPRKTDGGLNWQEVTTIITIGVEDTHD